jgi:hypothetical protein
MVVSASPHQELMLQKREICCKALKVAEKHIDVPRESLGARLRLR